jgi:membrane protein
MADIRGVVASAKSRFAGWRARYGWLDHAVRAVQHFGAVQATILAGAVTYFGMLSIFPILALVFAVIGYIAAVDPGARDQIITALRDLLPGLFDQLSSDQLRNAAGAASVIGVLGFLYSGLGWLAALRTALQTAFQVPPKSRRNAIVSKLVDLVALAIIGGILMTSVAASSVVTAATNAILEAIGLADVPGTGTLLRLLGVLLGIAASTLLFFVIFKVLAGAPAPARDLWQGALLAAVGFEVLKLLATWLISSASSNPVYGSFAITVALLVWINYFARVTMLGASWAITARTTAERVAPLENAATAAPTRNDTDDRVRSAVFAGAVMGASAVVFAGLVRRIRLERDDRGV